MPRGSGTSENTISLAPGLSNAVLHQANLSWSDLSGAALPGAVLSNVDFTSAVLRRTNFVASNLLGAKLADADLRGAKLTIASLHSADLSRANMTGADLTGAILTGAILSGADLSRANLTGAVINRTNLSKVHLHGAQLNDTILIDVDLAPLCDTVDLRHSASSRIEWSAVAKSYRHPRLKQFMIDAGVPALVAEYMIDCVRALGEVNIRAMLQSTFISYGTPDEPFARKLYEALKAHQVVTFFFPEDAVPGERLHRTMRKGVNEHDRVLLVCSKASLVRNGVRNEIQETLAREARDGGATYLLPITIDDYVFSAEWREREPAVSQAVLDRVVADFRGAGDAEAFDKALGRVIQALKVKPVPSSLPHGTPV